MSDRISNDLLIKLNDRLHLMDVMITEIEVEHAPVQQSQAAKKYCRVCYVAGEARKQKSSWPCDTQKIIDKYRRRTDSNEF